MPMMIAPVRGDRADWSAAVPMDPVRLSPVQIRIVEFIADRQADGSTPSYAEIAARVGRANRASIGYQIRRLQHLGVLRKPSRLARAIALTGRPFLPI